jgi:hypothetical protein
MELTIVTALSRCVVKYQNQNDICPNNNSIYYIDLYALTYLSSYPQLLILYLKHIKE